MPDNGKYDDTCSCGLYCYNFLLNFDIKLGRIDPGIVPDVTSEFHWEQTKSCMIFVLDKLMKPFAEFSTLNNGDYCRMHSVSGKMAGKFLPENCNHGPPKYSIKK